MLCESLMEWDLMSSRENYIMGCTCNWSLSRNNVLKAFSEIYFVALGLG